MSILLTGAAVIYVATITLWSCGALYYDAARATVWGWGVVALWLTFTLYCVLLVTPLTYGLLVITAAFVLLIAWWFGQKPRNDRNWDPNFSKTSRILMQGDNVTVENVRNSRYRSPTDYDLRYETRFYRLSDLQAADVLILFWGSTWMSHPMVIFDFKEGQHLCFSVEVRYRQGQTYSIVRSLYRQYELMHVVSDERDAILLRTKFGENQDCYLYRLQLDMEAVRQLFQEYAAATNQLAESPRWYHAVSDNCTTSILKMRTEKVELDVRLFLNGSLDRLLYERGRLDRRMPFESLKSQSWINDRANRASESNFSAVIRKGLPGFEE